MIRSLLLAALILTGAAPADNKPGERERRAEVVYSTVFLEEGSPPFAEVKISKGVSRATIQAIPDTDGEYAMIGLDCYKVSAAGKMSKCKIAVEPKTDALNAVAKQAIREIVIDPQQVRDTGRNLKWVSLQLLVSNSIKPVTTGPCWPPSCHFIPAPPPPPPAPTAKQD